MCFTVTYFSNMKYLIKAMALLVMVQANAWAQQDTSAVKSELIFFAAQKQKGIYRTFKEFRNNKPSIPYDAAVEEKNEIITIFDDPHVAYKLEFNDSLPCPKKTPIWGFCDGHSIFVSRTGLFAKKGVYDKVIFLGRYILYTSTETRYGGAPMMTPMAGGGGMMMGGGGSTKVILEFMINGNSGYEEQLTKEVVRDLIAGDAELSAAFKEEKKKKKVLGEYVMKYAVKHHDELKK